MNKKILAAVVCAATVLSLAGCGEKGNSSATNNNSSTPANNSSNAGSGDSSTPTSTGGDESTPAPEYNLTDDGDVLTIAAWGDNADITNMVNIFLEKKGYDASKVQVARFGTGGGTFTDAFETGLKDEKMDVDIICFEADFIMHWTNNDAETAPLSEIGLSESNLANPYAYTVAIGKNEAGVLKGLTFQAAPGGFVYRADLAEEYLGVKSPEEMQAKVKDWASLEATAKEFKEKSGLPLLATEEGLWQVYQYNRSQPWVVDGNVNMAEAESFYDVAKTYYDSGYISSAPQWDNAWYAALANGDCGGEFLSTWGMVDGDDQGMLAKFAGSKEGDDAVLAFCDGPQFYAWGGTWLGLSARCNNTTLAKEFIEFFTCSDEGMKAYTETTGDFCNNSKVMKDIVDAGHTNRFLVGGQDQFKTFLTTAPGVNLDGKLTKYDATIKSKFNDSVKAYMTGEMSKEEAIESFKDEVASAYKELNVD